MKSKIMTKGKLPSGLYVISSHDEGRRAGLTMDQFRTDVEKALKGMPPEKGYYKVSLVDDAGSEVVHYTYDSWGNPRNGAYGPLNAIFECGYGDESGFDYYFLLLNDYIKEHAVVNDVRSSEEVLRLKDETRMIYIGWLEAQDIICKYISENRVKLFHLLENGKQIKYGDSGSTSYLKGGLVYAISDKLDGNLVKKMNRYAKDCMKTESGLCYKVIKAGEDETKVQK